MARGGPTIVDMAAEERKRKLVVQKGKTVGKRRMEEISQIEGVVVEQSNSKRMTRSQTRSSQ